MSAADNTINRRRCKSLVILTLGGLLLGALIGLPLPHLIHLKHAVGYWASLELAWPAGVGLLLVAQGSLIALMSTSRQRAGHMVDPGDPREASVAQLAFYRNRALTLIMAGGVLLIPASLSAWPGIAAIGPAVPLGLMAVLLMGAAWAGTRMWRAADEFTRSLIAGSALFSLLVSLALLCVWQVAAQLGLTAPANAWSATGLIVLLALIVDSVRLVRHGYYY